MIDNYIINTNENKIIKQINSINRDIIKDKFKKIFFSRAYGSYIDTIPTNSRRSFIDFKNELESFIRNNPNIPFGI
jgi:hypothetical protein